MTLIDCLLTALLIVLPVGSKAQYDNPKLAGTCFTLKGQSHTSVYINDGHMMVLEFAFTRYEIPLPPWEGKFEVRYTLGSEFAKVRKTSGKPDASRIEQAIVDDQWSNIMVRFGPKESY